MLIGGAVFSWTQCRRISDTHKCPSSRQISLHSTKRCTRKVLHFYLRPLVFWRSGGPPGPKFTHIEPNVQQDPFYQTAKFRPVLAILLWDICCQISSISLTAWPTKNSERQDSACIPWTMGDNNVGNWRVNFQLDGGVRLRSFDRDN